MVGNEDTQACLPWNPNSKDCLPISRRRSQAENWSTANDGDEQQDDDRIGLGSMVASDRQAEDLAYAAAADGADNGGGANVDFRPQQHIGDEVRQHLRQDRKADALQPAPPEARRPSSGFMSAFSTTSKNSLPKSADRMDPYAMIAETDRSTGSRGKDRRLRFPGRRA